MVCWPIISTCNTGSLALEFTDCFHFKTDREELRRVAILDILQISHTILTDNRNEHLAETLIDCCVIVVPPNISRTFLRIYRCYDQIHSIIRGCEIVFVSNNRHILVLCIKRCSNCSFPSKTL